MGAMSASIKVKRCRQNRVEGASKRRIELGLKRSDDYGSYHSHHHLIGAKPDTLVTQQPNKDKRTSSGDTSVRLSTDDPLFKSVVFSSRTQLDSTRRRQTLASRTKSSTPQEHKSGKRGPRCSSKLVQTSSCISKTVSHRSIAVGVSDGDLYHTKILEKYQSKPISKRYWQSSSQQTRRPLLPGSSMTVSSGPYSRSTESSILAVLEAPPASYRHSRCMENHAYCNSPAKSVLSANKKTKRNATQAKEKDKRKLIARAKAKAS